MTSIETHYLPKFKMLIPCFKDIITKKALSGPLKTPKSLFQLHLPIQLNYRLFLFLSRPFIYIPCKTIWHSFRAYFDSFQTLAFSLISPKRQEHSSPSSPPTFKWNAKEKHEACQFWKLQIELALEASEVSREK